MSAHAPMPAVFFGHGSPMIALQTNAVTQAWSRMAQAFPRPKAILCVSAHWLTRGTAVTAMARPRTIHDFGAFPPALFAVQYPAPGDPVLARGVRDLLAPTPVTLDEGEWGLDHGTWSVLVKAYPDADVPVVQLSLDARLDSAGHLELGRRLAPLRDEGVLVMGTGNVVHNLSMMDWQNPAAAPYDWAERFAGRVRNGISANDPNALTDLEDADARLAAPSPDHYWPLLYVIGARRPDDAVTFGPDHIEHRSLSMMSVILAPPPSAAVAA